MQLSVQSKFLVSGPHREGGQGVGVGLAPEVWACSASWCGDSVYSGRGLCAGASGSKVSSAGFRADRLLACGGGLQNDLILSDDGDLWRSVAPGKSCRSEQRWKKRGVVNTYDGGVASEVFVTPPTPASPPSPGHVPRSKPGSASYVQHTACQSSVLPAQSPGLVGIPASNVLVECLEITGGSSLSGHLNISGAKNSALAVLAGALCSKEPLSLRMIPDLHDIRRMFQVLQSTGARVRRVGSSIIVDASQLTSVQPCPEAVRKLRASFFVIGALVGRQGEAVVPLPGGCNIGARPIDLHVRGLEALGAYVEIRFQLLQDLACLSLCLSS